MNHEQAEQPGADRLRGTRVLVVEDDGAVARVIAGMLEHHGCEVEHAEGIAEAGRALCGSFDAVLLDLDLPDGSGFDLVPALHTAVRPTSVVVVTGHFDKQNVASSIRAGITEYLRKPFLQAELVEAVVTAVSTTEQWRSLMASAAEPTEDDDLGGSDRPGGPVSRAAIVQRLAAQASLTQRERQVLDLMLVGKRNTEIAQELDISVHTVKYHARNTLTKLGSESRLHLFRTLAQEGEG